MKEGQLWAVYLACIHLVSMLVMPIMVFVHFPSQCGLSDSQGGERQMRVVFRPPAWAAGVVKMFESVK